MSKMATSERQRTRISSKIDRLPQSVKAQVDEMISDMSDSYQDISDYLKEQGHDISRGAVGRYALRMNKVAQRLSESLEKTKLILDRLEKNPELDAAKAAQALMTDGLMQRISTADGDFFEMPIEKAGRLLAELRRVDIAEKKLSFEMRKKIDLAFDEMEASILHEINYDPVLSVQFREILLKAKEKMMSDE